MLPNLLLLVCCLVFKFIECSNKPKPSTSLIDYDDDNEQTKRSTTGKLAPKKLPPRTETSPRSDWIYYPFPTSNFIGPTQFASTDTTHSHTNVQIFACIGEGPFGTSNLRFKGAASDNGRSFNLDKPLTSVSIYEKNILVTSVGHFKRIEGDSDQGNFPWYPLGHELSKEDELHKDDAIVTGKLVSSTMGYILTRMGVLIGMTWAPFSITRVFRNVSNFGVESNLIAVVTTDEPRGLRVFEGDNERAFFMNTRNEKLLQFADTASIVVINKQYTLFYDKSQAKLLNTNMRYFDDIPVGADMMYFEDPHLLALDGTTFTKYDIKGHALQRYKFEGFVRVIPDYQWSSFALHSYPILTNDANIQYVSRRVGQELYIASQVLEYILPKVLLHVVQSYLKDFVPEIPKSTSEVFATLTFVRTRQESDLSTWKPRTSVTNGTHTTYVAGRDIYVSGGKLKFPKKIDDVANAETLDFDFLTQEIVVLSEPPSDKLYVRCVNSSDEQDRTFRLGINDLERASFYRDDKGALHLMALTKTLTYDYIIGHQEITKDTDISQKPMVRDITTALLPSIGQLALRDGYVIRYQL